MLERPPTLLDQVMVRVGPYAQYVGQANAAGLKARRRRRPNWEKRILKQLTRPQGLRHAAIAAKVLRSFRFPDAEHAGWSLAADIDRFLAIQPKREPTTSDASAEPQYHELNSIFLEPLTMEIVEHSLLVRRALLENSQNPDALKLIDLIDLFNDVVVHPAVVLEERRKLKPSIIADTVIRVLEESRPRHLRMQDDDELFYPLHNAVTKAVTTADERYGITLKFAFGE